MYCLNFKRCEMESPDSECLKRLNGLLLTLKKKETRNLSAIFTVFKNLLLEYAYVNCNLLSIYIGMVSSDCK